MCGDAQDGVGFLSLSIPGHLGDIQGGAAIAPGNDVARSAVHAAILTKYSIPGRRVSTSGIPRQSGRVIKADVS